MLNKDRNHEAIISAQDSSSAQKLKKQQDIKNQRGKKLRRKGSTLQQNQPGESMHNVSSCVKSFNYIGLMRFVLYYARRYTHTSQVMSRKLPNFRVAFVTCQAVARQMWTTVRQKATTTQHTGKQKWWCNHGCSGFNHMFDAFSFVVLFTCLSALQVLVLVQDPQSLFALFGPGTAGSVEFWVIVVGQLIGHPTVTRGYCLHMSCLQTLVKLNWKWLKQLEAAKNRTNAWEGSLLISIFPPCIHSGGVFKCHDQLLNEIDLLSLCFSPCWKWRLWKLQTPPPQRPRLRSVTGCPGIHQKGTQNDI